MTQVVVLGDLTPEQMERLKAAGGFSVGGQSQRLVEVTYRRPMTKKIILAVVGVVLLALGFIGGYLLHREAAKVPTLRTKAAQLDLYCRFMHTNLSALKKDLETPNRSETMHGASVMGVDAELDMVDMHQIRPCVGESNLAAIPTDGAMCTKAFKNDDKCRIDALKKALDAFPEEYRSP